MSFSFKHKLKKKARQTQIQFNDIKSDDYDSLINFKQMNEDLIPTFLGGKTPYSENQKSKTFKPVGPLIDSIHNFKGLNYSKFFKYTNPIDYRAGYYGKSRLTGF
jgi:hypothetical protein